MSRLMPLPERDALFAAYRSWLAVTTTLMSQMDAAMKGQAIDWSQVDREVGVLPRLQREFIVRLRASLDEDDLAEPVVAAAEMPGQPQTQPVVLTYNAYSE
jgi:hypothetical protein